ncbi:Rho guanine nucleotide exchange factor, putative [Hondaea fermentalgiana]|uniref:Rho guanine nucleotide exchange factor, putative n=1 Tax=Hondaea fermentalgiana TaxID=2315210 RepID=A0A2R5GT43_9STRA|nr:Rho guanine nucleotide exchange factor, putative [Hondaea fermentalgiana]|eukprot:GBG31823.1 Rho guanine nucleotide exchange factor, putative [Hondaea fermentalgiana]
MAEWSDDIDELAEVLRVYKSLGAERESRLIDLITPYRRFLREESVDIKVAPFSANVCKPATLFMFKDMILLAENVDERSEAVSPTWVGAIANQGRRLSRRLSSRSSASMSESKSMSSDSSGPAPYKLTHRLDLERCTIKRHAPDASDTGFQLTHVNRIRDEHNHLATYVDMVEVWCNSMEQADAIYHDIEDLIEDVHLAHEDDERRQREQNAAGRESDATSLTSATSLTTDGSKSTGASRKWAKGKRLNRRNGSQRTLGTTASAGSEANLARRSRGSSMASSTDGSTTGSAALTLSDLEHRYRVEYSREDKHEAEFSAVFGEGAMGFSLSSGTGLGVIIGRVADYSMAEAGGVEVGDRVLRIGDVDLTLETTWREAVNIIKSVERPVEIRFVRNFTVNSHIQRAEERKKRVSARRATASAAAASHAATDSSKLRAERARARAERAAARQGGRRSTDRTNSASSDGQRSWVRRRHRNRSFGTRIIALDELEAMYRKTGDQRNSDDQVMEVFALLGESSSENVRACANTLGEIFDTECAFVRDLRIIVGDFLLPIRRTVHHVRCKDISSGSTFCEHHQPRMACYKTSQETRPILEADAIRDIFLNIETLVKVNAELLDVLNGKIMEALDKADGPENVTVTDLVHIFAPAFTRVMPFFRIYSLYCHSYTAAQDRLLVARLRNKSLDDLIKQREAKTGTTLMHLLIKPVQRICKYPLLFQSLLRAVIPYVTEELRSGADVDNLDSLVGELESAMAIVNKIAKSVDQKVGEQESLGRMMQVYAELGGEAAVPKLIAPSRRFVDRFEVLLRQQPFDDLDDPEQHRLFVFNDHLVFAVHNPVGYPARNGSLRRHNSKRSLKKSTAGSSLTKRLFGRRTSSQSTSSMDSDRRSSGGGSIATANATRTSASTSGGRSSGGGALRALAGAITLRLDLHKCTLKAIHDPDEADCFGIVLSYISREVEDEDAAAAAAAAADLSKSRKGSSRTINRAESVPTVRTGPIRTRIDKIQLWLATSESRDQIMRVLQAQIDLLQQLDISTKEATRAVGPKIKERNWRKLTRARSSVQRASRFAPLNPTEP